MYTQREVQNSGKMICCVTLAFVSHFPCNFSLSLCFLTPSKIILIMPFFSFLYPLLRVTCARTRLTYIYEETSIIIGSKFRLKHRTPSHACIKSLKMLSYHVIMLLNDISDYTVTVCWLSIFHFFTLMLDASSRKKNLTPDETFNRVYLFNESFSLLILFLFLLFVAFTRISEFRFSR